MAATAKPATKSEILISVAEETGLSRKQVASVLDALGGQIRGALAKKGPGVFAIPGLVKVMVINKPATPRARGLIRLQSRSRCSPPNPPERW